MTTLIFLCIGFTVFAPSYNMEEHKKSHDSYEWLKREIMIERILSTIRQVESGGNYNAKGESGEYGAYQFTGPTWDCYCQKLTRQKLSIKDNRTQDSIAELKVRYLLDKGYSVEQVSSIWNCGSPVYEKKFGVNRRGVYYNVPKYVEKFLKVYYDNY